MSTSIGLERDGAAPRRRSINLREHILGYCMVAPPVLFLAVIIVYPALKAIWDTLAVQHVVLRHGGQVVERTLSLEVYREIWNDPQARQSIAFSLRVTVITVIGLFVLCYPIAMYLRFTQSRVASMFRSLCLIPLFIPTIISAYAFISFYQQGNFLDVLLQDAHLESTVFRGQFPQLIDNATGIVMAQVWNNIPITVLLLGAGLGEIDNALIESARDIGAGYPRIFLSILLPLTLRQALIAFALAFIGVLGSYNIPALLGPTAPQMIGPLMDQDVGLQKLLVAQGLAVITFAFAILVGLLYVVALARQRGR
ncbi:MAG TPA: ABC transporter permease subunit [Chloroflexota bacterium]